MKTNTKTEKADIWDVPTQEDPRLRKPWMDPRSLVPLDSAARSCGIDTNTLRRWVESGHAPHYFLDDVGPLFLEAEIQHWVVDNLVIERGGLPVPRKIDVLKLVDSLDDQIPPALLGIDTLARLSPGGYVSGVYFLCKDDVVVYVGQSGSVAGRISTHFLERHKDFDINRVFFLPCPSHDLLRLERHYIEILNPRYNSEKRLSR